MTPIVEHVEVDGVVLEIEQQPLRPWARLVGLPLTLFLSLVFWAAAGRIVALVLLVAGLVAIFSAGRFRPKLRIEATPTRVRIVGWLGAYPLPDDRTFLLTGMRFECPQGGTAKFTFAAEEVTLTTLSATKGSLGKVAERLAALQKIGEGVKAPP